jgi:prolyl-tRNA synthetase
MLAGMANVLTPQSEDFPRWYQDVIAKARMAENGPARGTMIIRPWGYAIWERIQSELDARIKATGHSNVYFPLFIPMSFFEREADHVEGFSPELAVVTHGGGKELGESLAVRPTSETTIGDAMSRWVQGYRDLPLLLNQWANVVRWEMRPRLFLRTSEFLWQEGHTAHATWQEAEEETLRMLHEAYEDLVSTVLAIPTVPGRKTDAERFPGAIATYALESLMKDGKALQMGTSHNLGQNFAKVFDITFTDADGRQQHAWTTSWGMSTRVVGGLIMSHGDDRGLVLPPAVAPTQAVVIAVKPESIAACKQLVDELKSVGVRAVLDDDTSTSFGRRAVDWEIKGVPVRIEIGPRDLAAGTGVMVRRHVGEKEQMPLDGIVRRVPDLLTAMQQELYDAALARRREATREVASLDEIDDSGSWMIPWRAVGPDGEAKLAGDGYTVRCLVTSDGDVPPSVEPGSADAADDADLVAWVAKAY